MSTEDNGFPPAWRPDPGQRISGKVVSVTLGPDLGYGTYPIVTILDDSGDEFAVHAFHTVLRSQLANARPQAGDPIAILYHGKRSPKSGTGNDYHSYRVDGGQPPEFDWGSELPDGPPQPQGPPPMSQDEVNQIRMMQEAQRKAAQVAAAGDEFGDEAPF